MGQVAQNNKNTIPVETGLVKRQGKISQLASWLSWQDTKPTVAVLRLEGIIGKGSPVRPGLNISALNPLIEKAFAVNNLDAVYLIINSPGGSPVQAELIAERIINLSRKKDVPVYSFVEDVAASGGYWLAAAGQKIFASRSSIIGSIGVIYSGFGAQKAIEKLGIERRVYTAGESKSILDPFLGVKQQDIEIITSLQRNIHQHFIDYVKLRRGGKLTQSDNLLFNGEFWNGLNALDFGLIDGIDNMYSFLQESYGDEVNVEYIDSKQPWWKKKMGFLGLLGASDIGSINSPSGDSFASQVAREAVASAFEEAEQLTLSNRFKMF